MCSVLLVTSGVTVFLLYSNVAMCHSQATTDIVVSCCHFIPDLIYFHVFCRPVDDSDDLGVVSALQEELDQAHAELLQSCEMVNTLRRREKELTDR